MHISPPVTPYSSFLHLFVSKSFFMSFVKNFRKGKLTTKPMEKSLKEKHQGYQGLQGPLLNIGHPTNVLKREILFSYNFSWVFLSCTLSFLLDIKCNWWVIHVWSIYKHVCRFHWIILRVQFDKSTVLFMDSLDKPEALWSDMKAMLQK
jgi:CRISPR/Cas system-associated protein Csx1